MFPEVSLYTRPSQEFYSYYLISFQGNFTDLYKCSHSVDKEIKAKGG